MGDGAHLGITAGRALGTILGGEPSPSEEDGMTHKQFALWVRSAQHALKDMPKDDGYSEASRWLARRYLLLLEADCRVDNAWDAFKDKWPDDADEAGGMTGFMHGWALNAALYTLKLPPTPNPALLTIEV